MAQDTVPRSQSNGERREFFERHVRPLLAEHCFECHSAKAKTLKAGLHLDSRQGLLTGGDTGAAIVPGQPDQSLLISAVRYEDFEMPPRGRLPKDAVGVLERWITDGAWWPLEEPPREPARTVFDWQQRKRQHWAWQPLQDVTPPTVRDAAWPKNEIDNFVLARWEQSNIEPARSASRQQLLRRLYFDLVGLPPTPEQTREFLNDISSTAYVELVDQLLDSPHFGEKWARHWMDLVRYAETCGHEFDYPLHHAYQYRDYLIRAFNRDVPYDQLVMEHIAGDLFPTPRRNSQSNYNESIIGTGFWFLGEAIHSPTDVLGDEADRIDNQIDVFSKTFLGLTVACARCHDHKFDAIPTADYYAISGYMQSSRRQEALLDPHGRVRELTEQLEQHRIQAQEILHATVANATLPSEPALATILKAATRGDLSVSAVDSERSEQSTSRPWSEALHDTAIDSPSHPMFAWQRLSTESDLSFSERKQELLRQLTQQRDAARTARAAMRLFADFGGDDYAPWFVTGEAFGNGASTLR